MTNLWKLILGNLRYIDILPYQRIVYNRKWQLWLSKGIAYCIQGVIVVKLIKQYL